MGERELSSTGSQRILPAVNDWNREFWTRGEHGELCFLCCESCGTYVHPPAPVCPKDYARDLNWKSVSGKARVATYTLNYQQWLPGFDPPYMIAVVEIEEQPSVRLMTMLVNCEPEDVRTGMPVRVTFEHRSDEEGDVWVPLFEPDPEREG
jgi:uncharacterized OB-fold protein